MFAFCIRTQGGATPAVARAGWHGFLGMGVLHWLLKLHVRHLYDRVRHLIKWNKVLAHTNDELNERADLLAKLGANNILCGREREVTLWARDLV